MSNLHEDGLDGLWARIIKNAFAPVFLERFDYVVGNPPWVNWESLPRDYRQEIVPLWAEHELFPHKGFKAILGGSKDDISVLMTYVALDKYVKDGGRLGFLITQTVFKGTGASQGFRRFRLGDGTPLRVVLVDDMADIKPFAGASNRTAVVVLERGAETEYPVEYSWWYKPSGGAAIPEDLTLQELQGERIATYRRFYAEPVSAEDPTSSWITGRRQALSAVRKVLGSSDYRGREGINSGGANAVYWLDVIGRRPDGLVLVTNVTERAKRKVEKVQVAIEPDLVYPLLLIGDVQRWQATPSAYVLATHEPGMRLKAVPENEMMARLPKTYAYVERFEEVLRRRSVYRRYFKTTDPFYSMFNIGDYTFAPYKVVWPNVASALDCAVVSSFEGKPVVPQHIVTLVGLEDADEAHFVCAVVNSSPINFAAQSYSQRGGKSFGTPHILDNLLVPRYQAADATHRQFVVLSKRAHRATAAGAKVEVQNIEVEIDQLAGHMWGLSETELGDIQRSLAELGRKGRDG